METLEPRHRKNEPRHEKTCFCHMRTTKAQISLRIRAVWSAPLFSLPGECYTCSFYIQKFKTLASLWSWAGRFESYLVANLRRQIFSWRGSNGTRSHVCSDWYHWSVCASKQFDWSLPRLHEEAFSSWLPIQCPTITMIRLKDCAGHWHLILFT